MGVHIPTDYLVVTPSFMAGVGSVFALGGGYHEYNRHLTPSEADADAIRRDWMKVAEDMRAAIAKSKCEAGHVQD